MTPLAAALLFVLGLGSATAQRPGRGQTIAIRAGTVHPVSGPAIENGVVIVRRGRIVAVGPADSTKIPANAEVVDASGRHVYPGLVDASGAAFADSTLLTGSIDAAGTVGDALDPYERTSQALATFGITTSYTSNRSNAKWRGRGAVLHPGATGYAAPRSGIDGALHLRASGGSPTTHPLSREKALRGLAKEFDALEKYEKARDEAEKKQAEYEKKFDEYIAWHEKKNAKPKAKKGTAKKGTAKKGKAEAKKKDGEAKPAAPAKKEPGSRGRGRGGRGGDGGGDGGRHMAEATAVGIPQGKEPPKPTKKTPDGKKAPAKSAAKTTAKSKSDKAPTRPKRPKPWVENPVNEVLLKVKAGDVPLRIEAIEVDEVRAALRLARKLELSNAALEQCFRAGAIANEIARAGLPVVLAGSPPARCESVAAELAAAGVAVALGSGDNRTARHLTLLAADACAAGLPKADAIRALTLTPAKILGLGKSVGSIETGKRADLLITTGPLLHSDTRIQRVIARGRTVFELPQ